MDKYQVLDAITLAAIYHGLDFHPERGVQLDNIHLGLPDGSHIKVTVYPSQVNLFLIKSGILIGRTNDCVVWLYKQDWQADLMDKISLLKTLHQKAGVCKSCGKALYIYKQTNPDHKHYNEYYARCASKKLASDPHSQVWLERKEVNA